jgi:hypothetical protein
MRLAHYLVVPALLLALMENALSAGTSFPGRRSSLSPKKSWRVRGEEYKVHEGAFELILHDSKHGTEKVVFSGGRWCEVLWRPDESYFAITDWGGSNYAEILLMKAGGKGPAKRLDDLVKSSKLRETVSAEEQQGHCYWEALKWEADGRLRFRVFGHTDVVHSREFSHEFLVEPQDGAISVVKRTHKQKAKK